MPQAVLRPLALADLCEIWAFIAEDSVEQADAFVDDMDGKLRLLARQPGIGRQRPELAARLRSFAVGRYLIFYLPLPSGIDVVRVLTVSHYRTVLPWLRKMCGGA